MGAVAVGASGVVVLGTGTVVSGAVVVEVGVVSGGVVVGAVVEAGGSPALAGATPVSRQQSDTKTATSRTARR